MPSLTCDCTAEPDEPHDDDCIHWTLTTDDASDHYGH